MRTILITGSTDGIGKLTAQKLAQKNQSIVLHGRNEEKLKRTIENIKNETQNDNIVGVTADLSEFEHINKISEFIEKSNIEIDVLINNAGVFKASQPKNKNGLDLRFMVNYFAPYVLSQKLIPLMKESSDKRIINLSSAAQESVSLAALSGKKDLSAQNAYAQSKLALTMWSFHLSKSLKDFAVILVNPGSLLDTNMVREAYGRFWSPVDKGADILLSLALEDEYSRLSGKYFDNDLGDPVGRFGQAHNDAYDNKIITEVLAETESVISTFTV